MANGGGGNHPKYTKQKSENGVKKQSKKKDGQGTGENHLAPPVIINEDSQSNFASESCRDSVSSSDQVLSLSVNFIFNFLFYI